MTQTRTRTINHIRARDWTGQKRIHLKGQLAADVTIGELAEAIRERMGLPRRNYAVYFGDQKLPRTATLEEAGLADEAELELNPEVKAGAIE